jgi:hypothetical protein
MHVFADRTSLLGRLSLEQKPGLETYWSELADFGAQVFPHAGGNFVDFHYALAAATTANGRALE